MKLTITNDDEHAKAMEKLDKLMSGIDSLGVAVPPAFTSTAEAIEKYEEDRWPIEEPTEEEMKAFRKEQEK